MEKLSICHICGRTIDGLFPFCPWCRSRVKHDVTPGDFTPVFVQPQDLRNETAEHRIQLLSLNLGKLEKELDLFLNGVPAEHPS